MTSRKNLYEQDLIFFAQASCSFIALLVYSIMATCSTALIQFSWIFYWITSFAIYNLHYSHREYDA